MRTAIRTKKKEPRTNEELELLVYSAPEFAEHVREFFNRMSTRCQRCGGLMVRDCDYHAACRCVQCGDMVDPIILKNRTGITPFEEPEYEETEVLPYMRPLPLAVGQ